MGRGFCAKFPGKLYFLRKGAITRLIRLNHPNLNISQDFPFFAGGGGGGGGK